jgi:hypothetical protein
VVATVPCDCATCSFAIPERADLSHRSAGSPVLSLVLAQMAKVAPLPVPVSSTTNIDETSNEILPFLYLGSEGAATPALLSRLVSLRIVAVLNVTRECEWGLSGHRSYAGAPFGFVRVAVRDSPADDLLGAWPYTCAFIESIRQSLAPAPSNGPEDGSPPVATTPPDAVLVHCAGGISRSAATVVAYLMWRCGLRAGPAIRHARSRRPLVAPLNFAAQLAKWERALESAGHYANAPPPPPPASTAPLASTAPASTAVASTTTAAAGADQKLSVASSSTASATAPPAKSPAPPLHDSPVPLSELGAGPWNAKLEAELAKRCAAGGSLAASPPSASASSSSSSSCSCFG